MNICFFSREYPPETHSGGIGTYTYNMAMALSRLGHTIHVITYTEHSEGSYQDNGVVVHRLRSRRIIPKELWHFNYSYAAAKKVSQINCMFDIVQSSEFASEAFWFALNKIFPLVTRLATPMYLSEELDGRTLFRPSLLLNWMEKKQTLNSDGIFTSTRSLARVVTEKWGIEPSRVEIIPNSVDVSRIMKLAEDRPAPEQLKGKDFLLYFGRLEERKGVRVLAQALPSVLERCPSLYMVFVGSDLGFRGTSLRKYIQKRSGRFRERLIFFDNQPQEVLFPMVHLSKLVILPSLWEAFGFVCVEAMALGRPVIATSGSGFEEIIENDISGFLVKPGNSGLLAEKIIHALDDEKGLLRISEGARQRARDFDAAKVAVRLVDYYQKIKEEWLKKKTICKVA